MNPLIEKFEEVYGKKPVEGGLVENIAGADASPDAIKIGDTVIPTAQVTSYGINLTGDYIDSSVLNLNPAYISNGITSINANTFNTLSTYKRGFEIPNQTPVEQQFCKVMQNVADGKATVSAISADIDQSFTGFGGQIKYTVEIIGTYP